MDTRQLESVRDDVSSWTSASEQLAHKAPAPPRLIGPVLGPAMVCCVAICCECVIVSLTAAASWAVGGTL